MNVEVLLLVEAPLHRRGAFVKANSPQEIQCILNRHKHHATVSARPEELDLCNGWERLVLRAGREWSWIEPGINPRHKLDASRSLPLLNYGGVM